MSDGDRTTKVMWSQTCTAVLLLLLVNHNLLQCCALMLWVHMCVCVHACVFSDIIQEPIERFDRTRLILQVGSALFRSVTLLHSQFCCNDMHDTTALSCWHQWFYQLYTCVYTVCVCTAGVQWMDMCCVYAVCVHCVCMHCWCTVDGYVLRMMQDVIRLTPTSHTDYDSLQKTLVIAQSYLHADENAADSNKACSLAWSLVFLLVWLLWWLFPWWMITDSGAKVACCWDWKTTVCFMLENDGEFNNVFMSALNTWLSIDRHLLLWVEWMIDWRW